MPSRRDLIRMTADEIRGYLAGHRRLILVTNGSDGMPHPVPMNYGLDEEGRVIVTSFRKSQKVRNIERDPRAALLVESGAGYHELKTVVAYCDAGIIDDPALVRECMRRIRAGEAPDSGPDRSMMEQVEASIAKRVILRFEPFRYLSWDHGKLGSLY